MRFDLAPSPGQIGPIVLLPHPRPLAPAALLPNPLYRARKGLWNQAIECVKQPEGTEHADQALRRDLTAGLEPLDRGLGHPSLLSKPSLGEVALEPGSSQTGPELIEYEAVVVAAFYSHNSLSKEN
jgi:hypothetical protein